MARPRFELLQLNQVRQVGTAWVRRRPLPIAIISTFMLSVIAASGHPTALVIAAVTLMASQMAYFLYASFRARKRPIGMMDLAWTHGAVLLVQGAMIAMTGGLAGPLAATQLGPAIGTICTYGRSKVSWLTVAGVFFTIITIGLFPRSWLGPVPPSPYYEILVSAVVLFNLTILAITIMLLTDAYGDAFRRLTLARESLLSEAQQRSRSLEGVGLKVAHELKNPLAAIKSLCCLLEKHAADERSRERLSVIAGEVKRMETVLAEYLSFSRPLESLNVEPVEVNQLVEEVVGVVEARSHEAGIQLAPEIEKVTVYADRRRLRDALLNLISNAIEATPRGGQIRLALKRGCIAGGAELYICDSGRGMCPDTLARVGTPFFTTREGGTGLGVTLARAAIAQHGGDLHYESAEGSGTTVVVKLPDHPPEDMNLRM